MLRSSRLLTRTASRVTSITTRAGTLAPASATSSHEYRHHHHTYRTEPVKTTLTNRKFWSLSKKSFRDSNTNAAQAEKLITSLQNPTPAHPDIELAAKLAIKAVEEGSPRGKTLLASLHREGFAVQKDLEKAERLFIEASEAGDPIAQCSVGVLQLSSLKNEQQSSKEPFDVSVAVDEKGEYVASQIKLVNEEGKTEEGDENIDSKEDIETPAKLVRTVRKERRKAGFTDQQAREFEQYKRDEESKKQQSIRQQAHEWLKLSIEQGNDTAMLALANDTLKEDTEKAVELYELAAKQHRNADAYYALGQIYERGFKNIKRDLRKSFQQFSMGAQLGDASAQLYMGYLYHQGSFVVDIDWLLARKYIEMAVYQKHPAALHYYSMMYRNADCGIEKNEDKFRNLVIEAALDFEYGPSLVVLADLYYHGSDGMEVDYEKALDCFERAGKVGEVEAICSAAAMIFHGTGTIEQDRRKAFEMYQDASVKGSINALRNLSSMYFYGHGVPCNRKLSEHFMRVADETEQERKTRKQVKGMDHDGDANSNENQQNEDVMEILTEPAPDPEEAGVVPRPAQMQLPGTRRKQEETSERGAT